MSVEHIAIVLHHSRARGTAKLVLVGIANHDGDAGAFPSQETLAKYANVDVRNVRKAIESLVALGEVTVHERGGLRRMISSPRHQSNRYEILVECPAECDRTPNHRVHDRAKSSAQECEDGNVRSLKSDRTKSSRRDRTPPSGGDRTPPSYEPSVQPSAQPSTSAELALVPSEAVVLAAPETAQTVLSDYLDWCSEHGEIVPSRVKGHLAREIKQLLEDGFAVRVVKLALVQWHGKDVHPSALASFAQQTQKASGMPGGQSRTEERVQAGLDVASRMAAREAGGPQ